MTTYTPNNKPQFVSPKFSEHDTKCSWLLPKEGKHIRCDKPTNFVMVKEEDGISHREYYAFCPLHLPLAIAQSDNEEF